MRMHAQTWGSERESASKSRRAELFAAMEVAFSSDKSRFARTARRLSWGVMDPEDLLSEALLSCLEARAGSLPPDHLNAYLATAMRNRVIDELRSSRRREVELSEQIVGVVPPLEAPAGGELGERELVRAALARVSEVHCRYLIRTVVEGRKPRELVDEFGRSAAALSSLAQRARNALARALSMEIIERCAATAHRRTSSGQPCSRCEATWAELALAYGSRPSTETLSVLKIA